MFALVDCNNFFVSCERVFNPKLENQPIVILSNNDGCVIARSNEAKMLGIKMGAPYFEVKNIIQKYSIFVFSSNYKLYGNMSRRVFSNLKEFTQNLEEYSIDEAFLDLGGMNNLDLASYGMKIRSIVKRNTGIPVSIGIGKTKTLAKIANFHAKQSSGVVLLKENDAELLKNTSLNQIWGIGKQHLIKLHSLGIQNAFGLQQINSNLSKSFDSHLLKTIYEIKGYSCKPIEQAIPPKNIISSRSFCKSTNSLDDIKLNLATYTAKACEKLRKYNSTANSITVFLRGKNYSSKKEINYGFEATDDTRSITKLALNCLSLIYNEKDLYHKAGIILHNIEHKNSTKSTLKILSNHSHRLKTMQAIDGINRKYKGKKIYIASEKSLFSRYPSKSEMKSSALSSLIEVS